MRSDGSVCDAGEIIESEPPRLLVIRWQHLDNPELKAEGDSRCTTELEPSGTAVKPSITHTIGREPSKLILLRPLSKAQRAGRPAVSLEDAQVRWNQPVGMRR